MATTDWYPSSLAALGPWHATFSAQGLEGNARVGDVSPTVSISTTP